MEPVSQRKRGPNLWRQRPVGKGPLPLRPQAHWSRQVGSKAATTQRVVAGVQD